MPDQSDIMHATCVAWDGRAVLITGASGRGKSGLALELLAYGCVLVSDDRTKVSASPEGLWAAPPKRLAGMIEARHLGLLNADHLDRALIHLVVDLDQTEITRLPEPRSIALLGHSVPLLHKVESVHFPAAILQYLKAGRRA